MNHELRTTKSVHRFYVAPAQISEGRVRFTREQAHQIARVLRMRRGDSVAVFDGTGHEHEAELITVGAKETSALLKGLRTTTPEPARRLILLQGFPKGEKMEVIIRQATELGICRIVPVLCQRSVARGAGRLPRWRLIAQEAAEQSGRAVVPRIDEPIRFTDLSAAFERAGLRGIMLWEDERSRGFKEALQLMATVDPLHLLVGPEGGLAEGEVRMAEGLGFVTASLGRRTLRTETATIAALGIIQNELGELGLAKGG